MRSACMGLCLLTLGLASGCINNNRIVASRVSQANTWYGELGITGHGNDITIQSGSDLTRLSIIGDFNKVRVEPRSTLGKIEIWGKDCKVYVPARMVIRKNVVGHGSEIIFYDPYADTTPPDQRPWIEELPGDDPFESTTYIAPAGTSPPPRSSPGAYPGDATTYTPQSAPEAGIYEMQPVHGG